MSHLDIHGWFDSGIAKLYSQVAYEVTDESSIVEVGVFEGKSTAYMIEQLRLYKKDVDFYAVDIWKSHNTFLRFQRNMMSCGYNKYVKPIRAPSTLAALQFKDKSLSFVFIDGCHKYDSVKLDILAWLPKVKPGGVIAFHDIHLDSVRKAINELICLKNGRVFDKCFVYRIPK